MTIVDRWQRTVTRCRLVHATVLVHPMTTRVRTLERDGVVVIMVNYGLPLAERCEEVERWLRGRSLHGLAAAG